MNSVVDVEQLVADFDSGAERNFGSTVDLAGVVLDAEANGQAVDVLNHISTEFDC